MNSYRSSLERLKHILYQDINDTISPSRGSQKHIPSFVADLLTGDSFCESYRTSTIFTECMEKYMREIEPSLTDIQKETMRKQVLPLLDAFPLSFELYGECIPGFSVENELLFERKDERGIHYLLVDDDGTIAYGRVGKKPGDYDSVDDADGYGPQALVDFFMGIQRVTN